MFRPSFLSFLQDWIASFGDGFNGIAGFVFCQPRKPLRNCLSSNKSATRSKEVVRARAWFVPQNCESQINDQALDLRETKSAQRQSRQSKLTQSFLADKGKTAHAQAGRPTR